MKRNIFRKMLVAGIIILFFGILVQPITSTDIPHDEKIVSNDISETSKLEEDCNCPNVDKSGRPICDLLLERMNAIDLKLVEISELYEQYKDNPILGPIYAMYALILLYQVSFLTMSWELFNCEIE